MWLPLLALLALISVCDAGCPFQNPFWFVEKPMVVPVKNERGDVVPNKIRLMWGRMENFKCVDYFQVEYFQRSDPANTVQMTPRINRHRRSVEIEVMPCTEYFFKVIASEDWKGMREDFKMFSEVVSYKLDYTPRFIRNPQVKEKRKLRPDQERADRRAMREKLRRERLERQKQMQAHPQFDFYGDMADNTGLEPPPLPPVTTPAPEPVMLQVRWKLGDVDYPNCLDYFILDYYDTLYNESGYTRTFKRPFYSPKFELEVSSGVVPCEQDFEFYIHAVGINNMMTTAFWTPPSCIVTTPAPTTTTVEPTGTTPTMETTTDLSVLMDEIQAENERLQAKIDGLKQEYEKIGLQVFHSFKESFFQGLEDFLARRKSDDDGFGFGAGGGGAGGGGGNGANGNDTDAMFG